METKHRSKGVVGLTKDPRKSHRQHKTPIGWVQEGPFLNEKTARAWQRWYLDQGYAAVAEESGWRYGFRYPIAELKD